jgi:hypothetical protein
MSDARHLRARNFSSLQELLGFIARALAQGLHKER